MHAACAFDHSVCTTKPPRRGRLAIADVADFVARAGDRIPPGAQLGIGNRLREFVADNLSKRVKELAGEDTARTVRIRNYSVVNIADVIVIAAKTSGCARLATKADRDHVRRKKNEIQRVSSSSGDRMVGNPSLKSRLDLSVRNLTSARGHGSGITVGNMSGGEPTPVLNLR